jgi:hypothetical protein
VPCLSRTATSVTLEQRYALTQIPADLSGRELACSSLLSQKDLDLIPQQNRPGFAVHLAVVRIPRRPCKERDSMRDQSQCVALDGKRDTTLYEHPDETRRMYTLRECGWRERLWLVRELLAQA